MKSFIPIFKTVFNDNRPADWPRYGLKAVIWQVRKRLGHSFDTRLENGAMVHVHPSTAYSGIFYARHPEGEDLAFLRKHASLVGTFVEVDSGICLGDCVVAGNNHPAARMCLVAFVTNLADREDSRADKLQGLGIFCRD